MKAKIVGLIGVLILIVGMIYAWYNMRSGDVMVPQTPSTNDELRVPEDYENLESFLIHFSQMPGVFVDPLNEPFFIVIPRQEGGVTLQLIDFEKDQESFSTVSAKNRVIADIISAYQSDGIYGVEGSDHEKVLPILPSE